MNNSVELYTKLDILELLMIKPFVNFLILGFSSLFPDRFCFFKFNFLFFGDDFCFSLFSLYLYF